MTKHTTIRVDAARYADEDDSLAAAAAEVAAERGLDGYDLSPRWEDDQRETILLDVPAHTVSIKINVFRDGGEWFGARWIDGEYDGCDSLDIADDATEAEAIEAARTMPLSIDGERTVARVEDANG